MPPTYGSVDRSPEDLTARARIRDAALVQFAEHGVPGATIKGIAEQAGVSPGLVQHHFGTKDNLRRACDDALLDVFGRRTLHGGDRSRPDFIAGLYDTASPLIRYLGRAAVEGGPAATAVLDDIAAAAEDFLSSSWPERFPWHSLRARDAAAVMCAMHTGVIVLHSHLARQMDTDSSADAGTAATRIGLAMVDVWEAMGEFTTSETG